MKTLREQMDDAMGKPETQLPVSGTSTFSRVSRQIHRQARRRVRRTKGLRDGTAKHDMT